MHRRTSRIIGLVLGGITAVFVTDGLTGEVAPSDDSSTVRCEVGGTSATTNIGSIPAGTKVHGNIKRKVRTGDRITIAMGDSDYAECDSSDQEAVLKALRELEIELH